MRFTRVFQFVEFYENSAVGSYEILKIGKKKGKRVPKLTCLFDFVLFYSSGIIFQNIFHFSFSKEINVFLWLARHNLCIFSPKLVFMGRKMVEIHKISRKRRLSGQTVKRHFD